MNKKILCISVAVSALLIAIPAGAQNENVEERIQRLEQRIQELEKEKIKSDVIAISANDGQEVREMPSGNFAVSSFVPDISVILNGSYSHYSQNHTHVRGFQMGHHGEKPNDGFSLGESEVNISANADDKFRGSLTLAIVGEHGEDKIEIEEAYLETLALPYGMSLKAGRMLPIFGYLNDKHLHTDDFYDRPLPYRVYMNSHYIDDGLQGSVVLPLDFYAELGGGIFRGGKFPSDAEGGSYAGSYTAYAKTGSDVGVAHSWQFGVSYMHTKSKEEGRNDSHDDGHNHGKMTFRGESDLYGLDFKYTYSPNGNNRETQMVLQAEYIMRKENGQYDLGKGYYDFDNTTNGWYAQAIYKFHPNWRAGYRYSEMNPKKRVSVELAGSLLNSRGHRPSMHTTMLEWANSEFSRVRVQYNYDSSDKKPDNQIIFQYTVSFGAHGAHKY